MAVALSVVSAVDASQANVLSVTGLTPPNSVVMFRRIFASKVEDIPGTFVASAGAASYSDFLYPFDVPITYAVYSGDGLTLLATSAPTTPVASQGTPWIRDLIFPALRYAAVTIVDVTGRLRAGRISPYYVTAQPYAVTVGDVRSGSTGQLQLLCQSHTDRDAVLFAMSTGNPCSLRVPSACQSIVDEMLFAPVDISETRYGTNGMCLLTVDFIEVDMSEVATFKPVTYGVQTSNANAAAVLYGSLTPTPSGLSLNFLGHTYADMYVSPTGIAP